MKTLSILVILFLIFTTVVNAQHTVMRLFKSEIKPRTSPPPPPPKPPVHSDTNKVLLSIWPSPATEYFKFKIKSPSEEKINVEVYDLSGRSVLQFEALNEEELSFGNTLESSLYLVRVVQGAFEETVKIVKTD